MSALYQSVEHVLASAASDLVKAARFVEQEVVPVLKKVEANQATVEAVTGLVSPQAANIERVAFALLGVVVNALEQASAAGEAKGLNVTLDELLLQDVKAVAFDVKTAAKSGLAGLAAVLLPPVK